METECNCLHLWKTETLYCADVVANCTCGPTCDQRIFVCGTYQLEESEEGTKSSDTNKRLGSLHLYQLTKEGTGCDLLQTVVLPGVLDAKWMNIRNNPFVVVALSNGQIRVFELKGKELNEDLAIEATHDNSIALTLDCSAEESRILASDSKGHVTLLDVLAGDNPIQNQWKAHDHEVWAVALCHHNMNVIYSGADDCLLKVWDIRDHRLPQITNRRHTMGVTCITTCKKMQHQLVTGSYDERIRLWDTRALKNPLKECKTGGGIWRLKWDSEEEYLLAACMHNGFHIYNVNLLLKGSYMNHKSLAYGADWVLSDDESKFAVTCSFYDRSLQMWRVTV